MSLPGKQRVKRTSIERVRVNLSIDKDPISLTFKDELWPEEKNLTVNGVSNNSDLIPKDLPIGDISDMVTASQYILSDKDMNMYEAFIYVSDTENGAVGFMTAFKTIPWTK